jgi:hypothetical protein
VRWSERPTCRCARTPSEDGSTGWGTYRVTGRPGMNPAVQWHHRGEPLTWKGETLTLAEWSERTGIRVRTLLERCRKGWSVEQVLTTPPGASR